MVIERIIGHFGVASLVKLLTEWQDHNLCDILSKLSAKA